MTYPPSHRLHSPEDFQRVYDRKRSAADGVLIVYACENGLPHPRLGLSVSKKVGNAVVRNRHKRLFREAFRQMQKELPQGVDLVLIPRAKAGEPNLPHVMASLKALAWEAARRLEPLP